MTLTDPHNPLMSTCTFKLHTKSQQNINNSGSENTKLSSDVH